MRPKFLGIFKTGQNKNCILEWALSFPFFLQNRTTGQNSHRPASFPPFLKKIPRMPLKIQLQTINYNCQSLPNYIHILILHKRLIHSNTLSLQTDNRDHRPWWCSAEKENQTGKRCHAEGRWIKKSKDNLQNLKYNNRCLG